MIGQYFSPSPPSTFSSLSSLQVLCLFLSSSKKIKELQERQNTTHTYQIRPTFLVWITQPYMVQERSRGTLRISDVELAASERCKRERVRGSQDNRQERCTVQQKKGTLCKEGRNRGGGAQKFRKREGKEGNSPFHHLPPKSPHEPSKRL